MANAQIAKVPTITINGQVDLSLSIHEAELLLTLVGSIVGHHKTTVRGMYDDIYKALGEKLDTDVIFYLEPKKPAARQPIIEVVSTPEDLNQFVIRKYSIQKSS